MRYIVHLSNLKKNLENATRGSESDREYAALHRWKFAKAILDTPPDILKKDLRVSGFTTLTAILFCDQKSELLGILPMCLDEHHLKNEVIKKVALKTADENDPAGIILSLLYLDLWEIPHLPHWITLNSLWFPLFLGAIARRKTFYEKMGDGDKHYDAMKKNFAAVLKAIPKIKTDRQKSALEALKLRLNIPTLYSVNGSLKSLQVQKAKLVEYFAQKDTGRKLSHKFKKKPASRPLRFGVLWHDKNDKTENKTNLAHLIGMKGPNNEVYSITLYDTGAKGKVAEGIAEHSDFDLYLSKVKGFGNKVDAIRELELDVLLIGNNVTFGYTEYVALACHRLAKCQMVNYCAVTTTGFSQMDVWLSAKRSERSASPRSDYTEKLVMMDDSVLCFEGLDSQIKEGEDSLRSNRRRSTRKTRFISGANFFKLSPELVDMWVETLSLTPRSTLTLYPFNPNWKKNYPTRQAMERRIAEQCIDWGVDPKRVIFAGPWDDVNAIYTALASCDIYLDSFPHTGGLSTIDGLISGLPVISQIGLHQRAIQGPNILQDVGLDDYITKSREAYVSAAIQLAGDHELQKSIKKKIQVKLENAAFLSTEDFSLQVSNIMASLTAQ